MTEFDNQPLDQTQQEPLQGLPTSPQGALPFPPGAWVESMMERMGEEQGELAAREPGPITEPDVQPDDEISNELEKVPSDGSMAEIVREVQQMGVEIEELRRTCEPVDSPVPLIFPVKITGTGADGTSNWSQAGIGGGVWSDLSGAWTGTGDSSGTSGAITVPSGYGLVIHFVDPNGGDACERYVLLGGGIPRRATVVLHSAATTGGAYNVRELTGPTSDVSVSGGTFNVATLGTDPGADDGVLFNEAEITTAGHDLLSASNPILIVDCQLWYVNSTGVKIYTAFVVAKGC